MHVTNRPFRNADIDALAVLLRVFEPMLIAGLSAFAFTLRHGWTNVPSSYFGITLMGALGYAVLGTVLNLYDTRSVRYLLPTIPRLLSTVVGTFSVIVVMLFLFKASQDFSRIWLVVWLFLTLVLVFTLRALAAVYCRLKVKSGEWARRIALLGTDTKAIELVRLMSGGSNPEINLWGLYALNEQEVSPDLRRTNLYRGLLSDLMQHGAQDKFDDLIIALDMDFTPHSDKLLDRLHKLAINVYYCLPLPLFGRASSSVPMVYHAPLVLLYRKPLEGHTLWFKRALDILASVLILLLASPIMLVTAVMVKLSSPGPIFFRQKRNGFNGEEFEMLKFRSMRVGEAPKDASGKERQATKTDPRITRVGRFIRATSIDELPQIINVLKGDMSLIGPRPHAISHNNYYENLIDRYASRHKMRPGLTGWAQLNGFRGETETVDKMAKRVEHDIWYIENWSLGLDIKILLLTPFVVLFQRTAY